MYNVFCATNLLCFELFVFEYVRTSITSATYTLYGASMPPQIPYRNIRCIHSEVHQTDGMHRFVSVNRTIAIFRAIGHSDRLVDAD